MSHLYPRAFLAPGKEKSIERRHPWIFSGAVRSIEANPSDGDVLEVCDPKGNYLCTGHYFDGNILIKILSFEQRLIDASFWKDRVFAAWSLRVKTGLVQSSVTNCFRLLHGEGDLMPGLIADLYFDTLVLQAHSVGMYRALPDIANAFIEVSDGRIKAVYSKSREHLPIQYAQTIRDGFIIGERENLQVLENGHVFHIDFKEGQKTGFFLDQRDNRSLLAQYSPGATVLNTFAYSGGFTVYALKNGAAQVDSVDVSSKATRLIEENLALNQLEHLPNNIYTEDTLKFLQKSEIQYDIVILDPPAYAKSVSKRHNAVQGYKRLNIMGIKVVKPGGLLFTFSCSQVVDASLFYHTITAAAIEAGRNVKVLHQLFQPSDHPVNIFHPEGSYLKGLVLQIL